MLFNEFFHWKLSISCQFPNSCCEVYPLHIFTTVCFLREPKKRKRRFVQKEIFPKKTCFLTWMVYIFEVGIWANPKFNPRVVYPASWPKFPLVNERSWISGIGVDLQQRKHVLLSLTTSWISGRQDGSCPLPTQWTSIIFLSCLYPLSDRSRVNSGKQNLHTFRLCSATNNVDLSSPAAAASSQQQQLAVRSSSSCSQQQRYHHQQRLSAHSSSSFYETFRKHEQQGIFIFPRYTTPPLPLLPETGRCGEYFVLFSRRNNSKRRLQYSSIPYAQTFLTLRWWHRIRYWFVKSLFKVLTF